MSRTSFIIIIIVVTIFLLVIISLCFCSAIDKFQIKKEVKKFYKDQKTGFIDSFCFRLNEMAGFVWFLAVLMPLVFGVMSVVINFDSVALVLLGVFQIIIGSINLCIGIYSIIKNTFDFK